MPRIFDERFFATVKITGFTRQLGKRELDGVVYFLATIHAHPFSVRRVHIEETLDSGYSVEVQYGPLLRCEDAEVIRKKLSRMKMQLELSQDHCAVTYSNIKVSPQVLKDASCIISGVYDAAFVCEEDSGETVSITCKTRGTSLTLKTQQSSNQNKIRNFTIETTIDTVRPNLLNKRKLELKLGARNQESTNKRLNW